MDIACSQLIDARNDNRNVSQIQGPHIEIRLSCQALGHPRLTAKGKRASGLFPHPHTPIRQPHVHRDQQDGRPLGYQVKHPLVQRGIVSSFTRYFNDAAAVPGLITPLRKRSDPTVEQSRVEKIEKEGRKHGGDTKRDGHQVQPFLHGFQLLGRPTESNAQQVEDRKATVVQRGNHAALFEKANRFARAHRPHGAPNMFRIRRHGPRAGKKSNGHDQIKKTQADHEAVVDGATGSLARGDKETVVENVRRARNGERGGEFRCQGQSDLLVVGWNAVKGSHFLFAWLMDISPLLAQHHQPSNRSLPPMPLDRVTAAERLDGFKRDVQSSWPVGFCPRHGILLVLLLQYRTYGTIFESGMSDDQERPGIGLPYLNSRTFRWTPPLSKIIQKAP